MATAERTAAHTRKAMEAVQQQVEGLSGGMDELRDQFNRIEALLNDVLKKQVIEDTKTPPLPTRTDAQKAKAGAK